MVPLRNELYHQEMKKKLVPASIRRHLQIAKHNLFVKLGRKKYKSRKTLVVARHADVWKVTDHIDELFMPTFSRWVHYRDGIGYRRKKTFDRYCGDCFNISSGDIVIDVGANAGDFSIECLRRGAEVLAFEADPSVYKTLVMNLSSFDSAQLFNIGLGNSQKKMAFYMAAESGDSSFIKSRGVEYQGEVWIDVQRLDQVVDSELEIKLIKCDAEGFEPEVFDGAASILRNTKYVSVDVGDERDGRSTIIETYEILRQHGFQVLEPSCETGLMLVMVNPEVG